MLEPRNGFYHCVTEQCLEISTKIKGLSVFLLQTYYLLPAKKNWIPREMFSSQSNIVPERTITDNDFLERFQMESVE